MKMKEESEKVGLKLNIQKTKNMGSRKRKILSVFVFVAERSVLGMHGNMDLDLLSWILSRQHSLLIRTESNSKSIQITPCLFNLYAEYIMRNTELEEAQAGIKIARRNIRNLRFADDTTLMAESEESESERGE